MSNREENKPAYLNIIASITSTIICCNSNNSNQNVADTPRNSSVKQEVFKEKEDPNEIIPEIINPKVKE